MKLNKNKSIGRVLFIVEGSRTEFSILRQIFCNLLGYSYVEKRRNRPTYFESSNDRFSQIAVVNTRESNIRDISENEKYLDDVFDVLREQYKFPIDQSAIYYLFDRDPKSNTDPALIEKYILSLANPYDNNDYKAGQLLLSEHRKLSCLKFQRCSKFLALFTWNGCQKVHWSKYGYSDKQNFGRNDDKCGR